MRFCSLSILSAVVLTGAVFVIGCSPSRHRVGNQAKLVANADKPYAACIKYCRETSKYTYAREACEQACNDTRKKFPYLDKGYSSYERCAGDMDNMDLNRLDIIEEAQTVCEEKYQHIHKRFGCKEGVASFYNAVTVENVCGSYTALYVAPQTAGSPRTHAPVAVTPSSRLPVSSPAPIAQPEYRPSPSSPAFPPVPAAAPATAGVSYRAAPAQPAPALAPSLAPLPVQSPPLSRGSSAKSPAPAKTSRTRAVAPVAVKGSPAANAAKPAENLKTAPAVKPAAAQPTAEPNAVAAQQPAATRPSPVTAPAPAPATPQAAPVPVPAPTPEPTPAPVSKTAPVQAPAAALSSSLAAEPAPEPAQTRSRGIFSSPSPSRKTDVTPVLPPGNTQNGTSNSTSMSNITPPLPSMLKQKEAISPTIPPSAQ